MHVLYSGCQKVPIYVFGLTLSSCFLAVVARTISETVQYTVSTSVRNCQVNSWVLTCILALYFGFCNMKQIDILLPLLSRMLVQCRVTPPAIFRPLSKSYLPICIPGIRDEKSKPTLSIMLPLSLRYPYTRDHVAGMCHGNMTCSNDKIM